MLIPQRSSGLSSLRELSAAQTLLRAAPSSPRHQPGQLLVPPTPARGSPELPALRQQPQPPVGVLQHIPRQQQGEERAHSLCPSKCERKFSSQRGSRLLQAMEV